MCFERMASFSKGRVLGQMSSLDGVVVLLTSLLWVGWGASGS